MKVRGVKCVFMNVPRKQEENVFNNIIKKLNLTLQYSNNEQANSKLQTLKRQPQAF